IAARVRVGSCVDVESQFALRNAAHLLARHPEPERSDSFAGPDSKRAGGHRCSRNESFGDQASMLLERWAAGKRSHQSCAAAAQSRPLPTYQGPHWDQRILGCFRASRVRLDFFAGGGTMLLRLCRRARGLLIVLTLLAVGSATRDGGTVFLNVPAAEGAGLPPASIPNEPAFDFAQLHGP